MLSEDVHKKIIKRFDNELSMWSAYDGTHLMAVATFGVGPTGLASVEEIALMLTTENWIPFTDLNEKTLIDRLTESNRQFIKGLRYNMGSQRPLASVELVDTAPVPTATRPHAFPRQEKEGSDLHHWSSGSPLRDNEASAGVQAEKNGCCQSRCPYGKNSGIHSWSSARPSKKHS